MAADRASTTGPADVRVPARRHRRRAIALVAIALFQFWLWGTRIVNLLQDTGSFSTAFVTVHLGLYVAAIGVGVVLAVLGVQMWRETRPADRAAAERVPSGGGAAR